VAHFASLLALSLLVSRVSKGRPQTWSTRESRLKDWIRRSEMVNESQSKLDLTIQIHHVSLLTQSILYN
jgi:hypothetical protein